LLVDLGGRFSWRATAAEAPVVLPVVIIEQLTKPFSSTVQTTRTTADGWIPAVLVTIWLGGCAVVLMRWIVGLTRMARATREAAVLAEGRGFDTLRHLEQTMGITKPLPIMSSATTMEPGVFGIFQATLLMPAGISSRLSDAELHAILAHELSHI